MKFRFSIYSFMFVSCASFAQSYISDMQLDSLLNALHTVIYTQKEIEQQEIKGVYRITPWHFVPSLNYDFINDNYYVTFSSGPLVTNIINKRQEKRRLSAIDRRYDNQIKSNEIRLKSLFVTTSHKLTNIQLSHEILLNDIEIYKIKFQEHANNEIDTESMLKEKSTILNKIKSHNNDVADIERSLLDIELLTETVVVIDLSPFYVSPQTVSLNSLNYLTK